jgi:dTDP-4-amino-4,6-dideoxygalactose transaminase
LSNWKVPLADINLNAEEIEAVTNVLHSRWLSMGPITAEFEKRFAELIGAKYAFAVTNCTAALHLAHVALGAGPGDKVICPSLTFVATANAIRYAGATPVFADITSVDDLNVSPDDIEAKIDQSTKGICVVHYGGYPCNMEKIMDIANRNKLYVVEDAAHAPGAIVEKTSTNLSFEGKIAKKCGNIGDIGCFSFFSNKNMTTAEGGMITTNSDTLADQIKLLRSHGMTSLTWDRDKGHSFSYDVVELGYNYRIDEIRSAIGLVQLKKLQENNRKRAEATHKYWDKLLNVEEISIPFRYTENTPSYHIFPIVLKRDLERQIFMEFLRERGIQTSIHYPPIHKFSEYKRLEGNNRRSDKLPITDEVEKQLVTLPLYSDISDGQLIYVVESIKEWASSVG